jgi:hypothetical protein
LPNIVSEGIGRPRCSADGELNADRSNVERIDGLVA